MKLNMLPILSGAQNVLPIDYEQSAEQLLSGNDSFVFSDVVFASAVHVYGQVRNTAGYACLQLCISVSYETSCARCLTPLHREAMFTVEKPIGQNGGAFSLAHAEHADDYVLIEDNCIDLDVPVREQIEADFPMRHLCREDCAGLCVHCGKDKNTGACTCSTHEQDPRLQKLADLLRQNEVAEKSKGGNKNGSTEEESIESKKR